MGGPLPDQALHLRAYTCSFAAAASATTLLTDSSVAESCADVLLMTAVKHSGAAGCEGLGGSVAG